MIDQSRLEDIVCFLAHVVTKVVNSNDSSFDEDILQALENISDELYSEKPEAFEAKYFRY